MDIRQLRYFVSVLEAKSLSEASRVLHVAQPALGAHIRKLEQELGTTLLRRHARGVESTEAGERLGQHARHLLRHFDHVRQDLMEYATAPNGRVSLCLGRTLPRIVAATIAERCRKNFHDIQLSIVEGWRKQSNGGSEGLEPDLVVTFRPVQNTRFDSEPLVHDELVFVRSANGRRLPSEIDFSTLVQQPLILPSPPHQMRHMVETAANQAGQPLDVYCDVDSIATTRELVKRGVANTLLPIACVREDVKEGTLVTASIANRNLQRTLSILNAHRESRSSAIDLVQREIRAVILEFAHDATFGWKKIM
jgi:LysR family transcriptional regulator, nitrogen assimilation regulatory protein